MIFAIPEVYHGIGYYQGVSLILWIICIVLLFMTFGLLTFRSMTEDSKETRIGYLAMANFTVFFAMCRIYYLIAVYDPDSYDFNTTLGYIFSIISILFILYLIETQVITQTKKIFTIITLITFGIALISLGGLAPRYFALYLMYVLLPSSIILIMLMYIYIIMKSTGNVRKKATLVFIGITLVFIAHLLDSEVFISLTYPIIPLEAHPIMMIIGIVFLAYANIFYKTN